MKWINITCDTCGRKITTTNNSEDWRIALTNERIPSEGGVTTDMAMYPLIKQDSHFCSVNCLKKFVASL